MYTYKLTYHLQDKKDLWSLAVSVVVGENTNSLHHHSCARPQFNLETHFFVFESL